MFGQSSSELLEDKKSKKYRKNIRKCFCNKLRLLNNLCSDFLLGKSLIILFKFRYIFPKVLRLCLQNLVNIC
jgi:hypothetical protein